MRRLSRGTVLMRRVRRVGADAERGTAALIAILLSTGVLLGMVAMTVDVGRLFVERRELQNGADAAALAVTQDAAAGCTTAACPPTARAQTYANANARDGASGVLEVCGTGWTGLGACGGQATPALTRCPDATSSRYVRVRTSTRTAGGQTLLPPTFARLLAGNGGYAGATVVACAQAAWGTPSSVTPSIPLAMSLCEWSAATSNGTSYAPAPPYPPYPAASYEHFLKLTSPSDTSCGGSSPGGFGWLNSTSCQAPVVAGSAQVDPGVSASSCGDRIRDAVGSMIYVPIYTGVTGTGSGAQYRVDGFAAFFVTGYWLAGVQPNRRDSVATGRRLCGGNDKCVYGYFTQGLVPTGGTLSGTATPRGASIVQLIG